MRTAVISLFVVAAAATLALCSGGADAAKLRLMKEGGSLKNATAQQPRWLVAHPSAVSATDNNYFVFSVQHCSSGDPWTIHGLWPQASKYSWPSYCTQVTFSESAISDLLPDMEQYWSSCPGDESNRDFWSHEYEKHGSCAPSSWSEHDYFQAALDIFNGNQWQSYCSSYERECKVHVYPNGNFKVAGGK